MPARKRRRRPFEPAREPPMAAPEPSPLADEPARTLPGDLLLEIVARTDAATVFRCAACCKPLRHDILSPAFLHRVCADETAAEGIVPPRVLGFLRFRDKEMTVMPRPPPPFTLAFPSTTPAAASFADARLAPFLSRGANADVLGRYVPLTSTAASRDGLVVLRRRHISRRGRSDICVFDPMTGSRVFFPDPPDVGRQRGCSCRYALLTAAADGIGCSFLLLAAEITSGLRYCNCNIRVQTVSSDADRKWGPVAIASHPHSPAGTYFDNEWRDAVVLGGLIHWLMRGARGYRHVLTYDVATATAGSIELPACGRGFDRILASSPDGRLRFLVTEKFTVSVWVLAAARDAGWVQHAVIDTEPALPALLPEVAWSEANDGIQLVGSGVRSGAVLLTTTQMTGWNFMEEDPSEDQRIVLDVETKEMRRVSMVMDRQILDFLYEVDLASRLSAMKTF
ncbi:unnamed protein product [Urochloa humidicola]